MAEEKGKSFWAKVIIGGIIILSWIILIGLYYSADISLKIPGIIMGILTGLYIVSLFFKKIYELLDKSKQAERLIKSMSLREVSEKVEEAIGEKSWDWVVEGSKVSRKDDSLIIDHINENTIYMLRIPLYWGVKVKNREYEEALVGINGTYRDIPPIFLHPDSNHEKIKEAMNRLSRSPQVAEVIRTRRELNRFGVGSEETERTIPQQKENKEEVESAI